MTLGQFEKQKYLNIETFRKNGQGVKTPVWFVQDGETLYVGTSAGSGKVKRIRRNGSVLIAPCTASGEPRGDWVSAQAVVDDSPAALLHVEGLMKKKYGLSFFLFYVLGGMRSAQNAALKISIAEWSEIFTRSPGHVSICAT
jgi:PPOX class probable F420-dependent enzyme